MVSVVIHEKPLMVEVPVLDYILGGLFGCRDGRGRYFYVKAIVKAINFPKKTVKAIVKSIVGPNYYK